MFDNDDFDDMFEDGFFNDEDCPDDMEDILEELEGEALEGEDEEPTEKLEVTDDEPLSLDEVFIVGSLFGQAYSEAIERRRLLKKKK